MIKNSFDWRWSWSWAGRQDERLVLHRPLIDRPGDDLDRRGDYSVGPHSPVALEVQDQFAVVQPGEVLGRIGGLPVLRGIPTMAAGWGPVDHVIALFVNEPVK